LLKIKQFKALLFRTFFGDKVDLSSNKPKQAVPDA
jgi:hypothetical protein